MGFAANSSMTRRRRSKDALGIDLPDSVSIEVHEESATAAHLVLPPSPALTEADLEGIAAGHTSVYPAEHEHKVSPGTGARDVGYFLDDTLHNGDELGEDGHIPSA